MLLTSSASFIAGAVVDPVRDRYLPGLLDQVDDRRGNGVLFASREWPYNGCSPVPMAPAGQAGALASYRKGRPDTTSLFAAGVGVPYREGQIDLVLSSRTSDTLTITDISADVHRADPSQPLWAVTDASGGCGDTPIRLFDLNLDKTVGVGTRRLKDRGVENPNKQTPEPEVNANPLGSAFTVSQEDPAEVFINVNACDNYFEFSIVITYAVNGASHTETIRPEDGDYKVVGGKATNYFLANLGDPGPDSPPPLEPADPSMFGKCT
ncbi:hypothetical protein FDA38_20890 [Kribbella jiaozuonensis]|uniref:Uncharacterized protein n=1 Tax=Kribbella jiaozuonensis TaxID=2575441 RepID=A0A4U3LP58_9ACTN|nr:hypothetical protein FDA38_20890 [Kribbella jiaozuonensis]